MLNRIKALSIGYSEVVYQGQRYGVTRTDFNEGKSHKIYAEELGGTNFISLNYYVTSSSQKMKPCEMPMQKVIDFLNEYQSST
ncbi:peptide methionine sulfoxide reductase [uncultured Kriegella sp.]|uniref:peptide methionine sulfoxide reductase n=1 Tax=uncultured Kriegella sp. TaxID=1798910 RepID=UPI0030DA9425|tara:strand:- start:24000 stop:24248 length:249 start_codon:yes stop_codon:yes gene_type:complete